MKIIGNVSYHSPEQSETDTEDIEGKRKIVVYDYSWRSDEVCPLFSLFNKYMCNHF